MKDAAPRIFRSLEKPGGRDEFDTIVTAAAAAYGSLRNPGERQAADLGRLLAPAWEKVSGETRRNLAAALSHSPRMPRVLIDLLLASPVEISAPFLISSPTLSKADVATLAGSGDPRIGRLLAGRSARGEMRTGAPGDAAETVRPPAAPAPAVLEPFPSPSEASAATSSQSPAEADGAAPRAPVPSPSLSPEFLSVTPFLDRPPERTPAFAVRQTLKRLVAAGRQKPEAGGDTTTLAGLVEAALERDERRFYPGLSRILALSADRTREIAADETGERLAVALKALKAGPSDALSILMMLKPRIGLDVAAFDRMATYYRALKVDDCRALLSMPRTSSASGPVHRPVDIEAAPHRPAGEGRRPDFGRRKVKPADRRHQSGS